MTYAETHTNINVRNFESWPLHGTNTLHVFMSPLQKSNEIIGYELVLFLL